MPRKGRARKRHVVHINQAKARIHVGTRNVKVSHDSGEKAGPGAEPPQSREFTLMARSTSPVTSKLAGPFLATRNLSSINFSPVSLCPTSIFLYRHHSGAPRLANKSSDSRQSVASNACHRSSQ
jgi:hypothetical protein